MKNQNDKEYPGVTSQYLRELGARIEEVANLAGGKKALARLLGTHESKLYRYIKGENAISAAGLRELAVAAGVRPEWLIAGTGPMRNDAHMVRESAAGGLVGIATLDTDGDGAVATSEVLALNDGWVHRVLAAHPNDLRVVQVTGDDMEPTLRASDLVIVDRRSGDITRDGIYALRVNGGVQLKRVQLLPADRIRISSDNPAYEPFTLDRARIADEFRVVGRVIWFGRPV